MGSPKFKIWASDLINIGKNALIVGAAAALTFMSSKLSSVDLGIYGPVIVPVVSVILDTAIKWVKDNETNN